MESTIIINAIGSSDRPLIILHKIKGDSLWVYDLTHEDPIRAIAASDFGIRVFVRSFYNVFEHRFYVLDRYSNLLIETDESLNVVARDTVPPVYDNDGMDYQPSFSFVANSSTVISTIGANAYIHDHLRRPCVAAYDRHSRTWRFLHTFPKDIQEHPDRHVYRLEVAPADSGATTAFVRFCVSDTVYRATRSGSSPVYTVTDDRLRYHLLDTAAPLSRSMEFYMTAPFTWWFYSLPALNATVSLCMIENGLQHSDGRRIRSSDRRGYFIIRTPEVQSSFRVPDSVHVFSNYTIQIGNRIGLPLKQKPGSDPRRLTLQFFDLKASLDDAR